MTKCDYCRAEIAGDPIEKEIWMPRYSATEGKLVKTQHTGKFCSETCATHAQFSAD